MDKKKLLIILLILVVLIVIICIVVKMKQTNTKKEEENLPVEQREEGGEAYNDTQLNNFDITIEGMEKEIEKEIKDMDDFELEFKKYIYLNGLVDANIATIESYNINGNELKINFQLNNPSATKMTCIVNISEQTYEFFKES